MSSYRSILSMAFAILVFLSGSSFIVGLHFCGGEIQNVALFARADGCERETQPPPCHQHETTPCCEDEEVFHEGQGFKGSTSQIDTSPQHIAQEASQPFLIAEIVPARIEPPDHTWYDPPLRTCDLTVSLQTFLI